MLLHISESLIDNVYLNKCLMDEFFTSAAVENIYFSDAVDCVGVKIVFVASLMSYWPTDSAVPNSSEQSTQ